MSMPAEVEAHAAEMRSRNSTYLASRARKQAAAAGRRMGGPSGEMAYRPPCPKCGANGHRNGTGRQNQIRYRCCKCKHRYFAAPPPQRPNRDLFEHRLKTLTELINLGYGDMPTVRIERLRVAAERRMQMMTILRAWRKRSAAA